LFHFFAFDLFTQFAKLAAKDILGFLLEILKKPEVERKTSESLLY